MSVRQGNVIIAGGNAVTVDQALDINSPNAIANSAVTAGLNSKQATITGAATTITSSNLSTEKALVSNSAGKVATSTITTTELGYLDGVTSSIQTQLNNKQATLVSGTNIKTINSNSLLGSGNIVINGLPAQTGNSGKYLTTNGTSASWNSLATVATSGSYNDLTDKPTIGGGYHPGLFAHEWDDHLRNDVQWLRADTFSWQDGSVYEAAYNHLVDDLGTIGVTVYAWKYNDNIIMYTNTETPTAGVDFAYYDSGLTQPEDITSVSTNSIRVLSVGTCNRYPAGDISNPSSSGAVRTIETIGSYTITYWLAADGHKICLPDQESNVAAIYAATGVAWYYIIDTANQRFKLPRTKFGVTGLRDTVGKYVAPGLPNIEASWRTVVQAETKTCSGAVQTWTGGENDSTSGGGGFSNGSIVWEFNASNSNSIYGNSTTVQPPATQMYLYFYVGSFTQTALENTAGITAETLNAKVDLSSSWGFPNGNYTDLTLGTSGSSYTAPADGWFFLRKHTVTANKFIGLYQNSGDGVSSMVVCPIANRDSAVYVPARKGQIVKCYYNMDGATDEFRFVYAKKTN